MIPSITRLFKTSCFTAISSTDSVKLVKSSHHILVEEVEDHVGEARVAPAAVDQQQLTEVFKPGDGKVAGHDSLGDGGHETYLGTDSDMNTLVITV